MALAVGLVGCQNDPVVGGPEGKDLKNVAIKISKGNVASRAAVAPLDADEEGQAVVFSEGALYFAADGDIVKIVNIIVEEQEDALTENEVYYSELENGKTFFNLPASIDAVHFVANLPIAEGADEVDYNFGTIEDLEAVALDLEALSDIENIAIYGFDDAMEEGTVGTGEAAVNVLKAVINARPVAARFEIGAIVAEAVNPEIPAIESFDLVGIYIDNIYTSVNLNGTVEDDAVLKGGEVSVDPVNNPEVNLADYPYPAVWHENGFSADFMTAEEDGVTVPSKAGLVGPGDNQVWGYNLPAPRPGTKNAETGVWSYANTAPLPYIVIELANVVLDNEVELGTKFLTLKQTVAKGANPVMLEQGKVFKVNDLKDFTFNASDLTDWPYQGAINIHVTVDIMDWTAVPVGYEFW